MNVATIYKKMIYAAAVAIFLCSTAYAKPAADDEEVMNQIIHSSMLPIAMTEPVDTGTLLFSDSPEYPETPGILYGDTVSGDCRVYFYHVNQSQEPRKIVVMAYNPGNEPVEAVLKGYQYTRPSTSYYQVGKELSTMYYEGNWTAHTVSVAPGGYALLGERLDKIAVQPDELFSGIVDVVLPSPMILSTMILPMQEDPQDFVRKQIYLPSDSAKLRGTFHGKDRSMRTLIPYSPRDGIGYIKIADGIMDRFLLGRDVMDDRYSEDVGNYGVDYTILLRTKGSGDVHLYFNPQGGEYAGVVELTYTDGEKRTEKKIVELPDTKLSMGAGNEFDMQYIDTFSAGTDVTIHMMPPGAANLPVRILVVPDGELRKAADAADAQKELQEKGKKKVEQQREAKESQYKTAAAELGVQQHS